MASASVSGMSSMGMALDENRAGSCQDGRCREYASPAPSRCPEFAVFMSNGSPTDASAAPPPLVVALIGLPGSGKTVVARALEEEFGLHRVCRDEVRRAMFPACSY